MLAPKYDEIRKLAEADLEKFIRLVHPQRVLGSIHSELIQWWTRDDAKDCQLVLLPRDHMKSALVAYRVAWELTKNPTLRVLYISSTSNLATKQLKFIKDILTSPIYRIYWPEMVNEEVSTREKWTESEISVDHPLRKQEAIRDPSIFTAGLTTNITGLHCDIAVLDDVVVFENAFTEEGRTTVRQQYSLLASIAGTEAKIWAVGTRYFVQDLYYDMMTTKIEEYDNYGEIVFEEPLYEIFERVVEQHGEFLWPRQQRRDGKWFGFDSRVLARKRAMYEDKMLFRAQYYNDPTDPEDILVKNFQYYEPRYITQRGSNWFFKNERLNIFAAVDFAYSLAKRADYTAIVVIGVDADRNYYVLEIDRFKADKIKTYFDHILQLHQKWGFRKLRVEVNPSGRPIINDLKENYIRKHGLALSLEDNIPTRHEGTKEERIDALLQARYQNGQIWHYRAGNCQLLEEELIARKPTHDDIKDALAAAIETAVAPNRIAENNVISFMQHNHRFGGLG